LVTHCRIYSKISRIFTIVVLAAQLSPTVYGTAMLALAFHNVFGLLLRAGVGSQLINCKPHQLESFAKNGIIIQWVICLTIALAQWNSADYLSSLYNNNNIAILLQIMALIYIFYPWVSIKIFLLQRDNKMRRFSIRNGICVIIENSTIAITALLGADIFAVALGKIAFSLFWLVLFSLSPVKSYGMSFKLYIGFLFVIQAIFAPIYVPIISILCLVALPNFIIDIVCCVQRVKKQYHRETFTRLVCLVICIGTLFIFSPDEPMEFAITIFFSSLFCLIPIYLLHLHSPFDNNLPTLFDRKNSHEN
jgi:hypothetical protein